MHFVAFIVDPNFAKQLSLQVELLNFRYPMHLSHWLMFEPKQDAQLILHDRQIFGGPFLL